MQRALLSDRDSIQSWCYNRSVGSLVVVGLSPSRIITFKELNWKWALITMKTDHCSHCQCFSNCIFWSLIFFSLWTWQPIRILQIDSQDFERLHRSVSAAGAHLQNHKLHLKRWPGEREVWYRCLDCCPMTRTQTSSRKQVEFSRHRMADLVKHDWEGILFLVLSIKFYRMTPCF